jgi:two-component sensor histidine kinase
LFLVEAEAGGPPVKLSDRKGFGTMVLQRMILKPWSDCTVSHEYLSEGVRWTIEVSAESIEAANLVS